MARDVAGDPASELRRFPVAVVFDQGHDEHREAVRQRFIDAVRWLTLDDPETQSADRADEGCCTGQDRAAPPGPSVERGLARGRQRCHRRVEQVAAAGHGLHDVLFAIAQGVPQFENELDERVIGHDRRRPDSGDQLPLIYYPFRIAEEIP